MIKSIQSIMRVFPNGSGLLLGLSIAFACAWFFPNRGDMGKFFFPEIVSKFAVVLIFLVQGWNLKISSFRVVYKDINRVVLVNGLIFIGPLIFVFLFYQIGFFPEYWISGFLFLAILPTTISSCVVYTTAAGGNSDVALGYATASNLLAIFWVPFAWVNLANGSGNEIGEQWISFGVHVLPQIFFLVVLPCLIGWLGCYACFRNDKNTLGEHLKKATFICILLLAYLGLSKTVLRIGRDEFLILIFELLPYLILFLIFHLTLSWFGSGIFSFNRKQRVAEFYCISQKSLAMGLPLAGLLIGSEPQLTIPIVCPLLIYHFLQLAVGTCFLSRLKEWSSRAC